MNFFEQLDKCPLDPLSYASLPTSSLSLKTDSFGLFELPSIQMNLRSIYFTVTQNEHYLMIMASLISIYLFFRFSQLLLGFIIEQLAIQVHGELEQECY